MRRFIWNTYLDSLEKKYSLFYINRKYKNQSFKDNDEYVSIQNKVAQEIDAQSKEIKKSIEMVIHEVYPEVEILLYDSLSFSRASSLIGRILTKGIHSQSETFDVKAYFEKMTSTKIIVERIEDLSDDEQRKVQSLIQSSK